MEITKTNTGSDAISVRLQALFEETGDRNLGLLSEGNAPAGMTEPASGKEHADAVSSCVMECYRGTGSQSAFSLLFELNSRAFLLAIQAKLRHYRSSVDAHDVLQEVFLNIYRYPSRFVHERHDSFRNWGHRIVYNTLITCMKRDGRGLAHASLGEDCFEQPDPNSRSPFRSASDSESAELVDFAYLIYLNLYTRQYRMLSDREQRALMMIEVHGASYKTAAAELGIRVENLKMVMFRSRRKIYRALERILQDMDSPFGSMSVN